MVSPSVEVAKRFGYTPGSFRVLVHQFRRNPGRAFFLPPAKGPRQAPKSDPVRDQVVALRKQNLSIYDISRASKKNDILLSPVAVSLILKEKDLPACRAGDEERPPGARPDHGRGRRCAATGSELPDNCRTKFGGLFLFVPYPGRLAASIRSSRKRDLPGLADDPGRSCHAVPAGAETVRHPAAHPRDERPCWTKGWRCSPA